MIKKTFVVKGMHCQGCENRVIRTLLKNEAIHQVEASHQDEVVIVKFEDAKINDETITGLIEQLDFKVVV